MSETTSPTDERSQLEIATATSRRLLLHAERQTMALPDDATRDDVESCMKLARHASDLLTECRKLEKAQGALAQGITREMVVAWAKQQPKETRARLLADLAELDRPKKGSVLG